MEGTFKKEPFVSVKNLKSRETWGLTNERNNLYLNFNKQMYTELKGSVTSLVE